MAGTLKVIVVVGALSLALGKYMASTQHLGKCE